MESVEDKVQRYTNCLENGIEVKKALKRLDELTAAPEVYKSLNTYKYVKRYESSPELSKYAKRVMEKLCGTRKRKAHEEPQHSHKKAKVEESSFDVEFAKAMKGGVSSHAPSAPRAPVDYSKYKVTKRVEVKPKIVNDHEHGKPSSSSSSSIKQDYHQKENGALRQIAKPVPQTKKTVAQSASLHTDENMFKPRKDKQKMFSGRRQKIGEEVPSLVQMCQNVLVANVNKVDKFGVVPYKLLAPALNHASTDKLRKILDANPMLAEDADEIFHELVKKEFAKYGDREKNGWTWREMYDKLVERKNKKDNSKLEKVTARIGKAQTAKTQGRQTMMIDTAHTRAKSKSFFNIVKPTQIRMTPTSSAIQLSQARRNANTSICVGVPTISRSRTINNNGNNSGSAVKKTAPLMAKCLKMLRR